MAIIEAFDGTIELQDADSERAIAILLPEGEPRWMLNAEFEVLN